MAVEDINKRVRAVSSKKIESGEEMQELQKSQSELLNIINERRNNLNSARVESSMDLENNQNLAQAAALMTAGSGMELQQQVQGFNPHTQALLGKYGVKQPKSVTSTSKNTQITPDKVTVNNVTTNNTTNNVQVSQPNIPMSQAVVNRSSNDPGGSKVKAWISGVFARQNERIALREKEYQKREWSLTRSANKMMRRMEEVGKTFASRLDPRKIGNIFGDQIKTLMFLFGFGMLSKNWDKVLGLVSKAEEFFNWVKSDKDKDGFFSSLGSRLTEFIGGKDGETFVQAFTNLFDDFKSRITDSFKNFGEDISDKFQAFMESRADAVKAIKFPDIDVSNIGNTLKALGLYLGDVMTALVSGTTGVKDAIGHEIDNVGLSGSLQKRKGGERIDKEYKGGKYDEVDDTSYGDAVLVKGDKDGKTYQGLLASAVTSDGELKDIASATISQSRAIDATFADAKDGKINTAQAASGLARLSRAAENNGTVVVDPNFITTKLTPDQINSLVASGDLKEVNYKLVRTEKTEEDLPQNWKTKFVEEALKTGAANTIAREAGGLEGYAIRVGSKAVMTDGVGSALDTATSAIPYVGEYLSYAVDAGQAAASQVARWAADKYKLELVPFDDPRRAAVRIDEKHPEAFKFYEITPKVISEIGKSLNGGKELSFNTGDKSFVQIIQDKLENEAKKWDGKRNNPNLPANYRAYDVDVDEKFKQLDVLNKKEEARQKKLAERKEAREKEYEEKHKKDRVGKTVENTKELARDVKNFIVDAYEKGADYVKGFIGDYRPKYVPITSEETKSRMVKAIDRLVKELGITPEQASGIVGNWMQESSMNTTSFNGAGGGEGAVGLAQWRGARIRKFEGRAKEGEGENYTGSGAGTKLGEATFDQQLSYAIWELQNSHKNAINKLKQYATDPTTAADIGLGYYEFSAGVDKAMDQLGSHAMLDNRRNYAWTAYQLYNQSKPEESKPVSIPGSPLPDYLVRSEKSENQPSLDWNSVSSSTPINIAQVTPVWNTSFSSSPEKATPVVTNNKTSDNLLTKVDEISNTLGYQTAAIQQLSCSILELSSIAINTGNTTINNNGGNISREPGYISSPGQNIG